MDVKQMIQRYSRAIIVIFFVLFVFKSFQSCNRQLEVKAQSRELMAMRDSLTDVIRAQKDTIEAMHGRLELAEAYRDAANTRADAVQSVAEKIVKNTTVKVEKQ